VATGMRVFVDTSALLAILDAGDPNHERATALLKASLRWDEVFTHNYIHVEAEQLVRRRLGAEAATRLLQELLPAIQTWWVDEGVHAQAVTALAGKGRAMSLVDQVSFVIMRDLKVDTALAFDSDFDREGFRLPEMQPPHTLSEAKAPYRSSSEASDLVSVSELAARSGRSVNTIQSWRRRHADFPSPNVELAAGPIWVWSDVSAWIEGRSPRTPAAARR
jgi:predicted nucleic acid-binding protein